MEMIPAPPDALGLALAAANNDEDALDSVLGPILDRALQIRGLYGEEFLRHPHADQLRLSMMVYDLVYRNAMLLEMLADERGVTPDELVTQFLDADRTTSTE